MPLAPGTKLGPYDVLAPLGAGGMGEVYRAKDTRLDREVAIKVLPERFGAEPTALARFEREAKAIAALSHPNILAIHDVGTEEGTSFVVTELLEGETLRDHLRRDGLSWRKTTEIGAAIADGLVAAHARGIVHRDLKPGNIFLTSDGVVKILDFGLARTVGGASREEHAETPTMTAATKPGAVMGTPAYMSPEQARGEPADARSDIFSFGCVLYEMVAGRCAFPGDTPAELFAAILKDEPRDISETGKTVPAELEQIIRHCLEKKPEERFQSARDLAFNLRAIESVRPSRSRVLPWVGVAGMLILVLAVLLFVLNPGGWRERLFGGATGQRIESLAILPFTNMGNDPDTAYLADEIPASIINSLSRLDNLRVIPRESVFHYMESGGDRYDLARELNVGAILTGRITVRGGDLSISAELVDVANDRQLWGERYSKRLSDILTIEAHISRQISEALRLRITGEEKARLAKRYTENAEAHLVYLQGRYFWNKETEEGFKKALDYFQKAIDTDPKYALAYTGLADACSDMAAWGLLPADEAMSRASEAAKRALEIDDTLAEAHVSMAFVKMFLDWDWAEAERELKRGLELNPQYGFAHHLYAHLMAFLGRENEALAKFEHALQIDPLSPHHMTCFADLYLHVGRYDKAEEWCLKALEIHPDSAPGRYYLGWTYVRKGMLDEAIEQFRKAPSICEASLAHAYARSGSRTEALRILNEILATSKQSFVDPVNVATIYVGLGETDQALDWLEEGYEKRNSGWLPLIGLEPQFLSLHGHPRFDDLLRRMGLPPSRPAPPNR